MLHNNAIAFNAAAFVASLFLLESGADKFIDHTAAVARRTGLSETLIGLLTAGAEWEELAVVVASLARNRSSLALGNVVGAAVSNILGAFSLGLLFYRRDDHFLPGNDDDGEVVRFDRSSRIYSLVLLVLTAFTAGIVHFRESLVWTVAGSVLIAGFGVYVSVVAVAIGRGVLTAPEDSDSDSDSDTDSDDSSVHGEPERTAHNNNNNNNNNNNTDDEETPLLPPAPAHAARQTRHHNKLLQHTYHLVLGFLAISLAGYILSQAATNITDALGLSDVLFGVIVLAVATTIPEKFVALMSMRRGATGHTGILVANCVGSNIFLLSLCVGIIMVDSKGALDAGSVTDAELLVLLGSTLWMTATVWFGGRWCRWTGGAMLAAYVGFILLEFIVVHRVW
ncbi:Sodium/calcium exchanger protein-domain-containing protein [Microdochium trichocladiopsis]|uniref:Sodium/calcium exchanger protein-domain-containing protein n=1 Tax=Microdochium trichocladiopsis TaxID=1682393 RepID=A0A9P9BIH6_9PEZI|nr:Sodium/calcium exchanger protein-domain-containing protein [Microdochium trichocladiopsis]KAH7014403.1 Sodium/calcium exchanger protein-domain-containing protein [Microdochium trichocladiopsis]